MEMLSISILCLINLIGGYIMGYATGRGRKGI
jgi:hypothetical protein